MSAALDRAMSRRTLLVGGALMVGFALLPEGLVAQTPSNSDELPSGFAKAPLIDSWVRIAPDGKVTVLTGKAELGQGLKTALLQIAGEELDLDPDAITLVTADTELTPDEGYTAGSHSMQDSGRAIRIAAAETRAILLALAAARLGLPADGLRSEAGGIVAEDGRRLSFGELVAGADPLHVPAQTGTKPKDPATHRLVGAAIMRPDILTKVTGGAAFVQDMRLPDMVHGRVVMPPGPGARLVAIDTAPVDAMPDVLKLVRDGDYLAVVAAREFEAVQAMRALARAAQWREQERLPGDAAIGDFLQQAPAQDQTILERGTPGSNTGHVVVARYSRPYQMHGSIGPSCAVALLADDKMTVWTHSQGVYPLRGAIAEMLHMKLEQVHCVHVEGSGCYGHNAADDAAGDAALLARALPGWPVRVQWMRDQEHRFEPYGPAMLTRARAALDGNGRIADWQYEVWSNTHSTRPGPAGQLLPARRLQAPFAPPPPRDVPDPEGGGDRNSVPLYALPNARILYHFIPQMPLRVSALRGLGAYMNIFSIESFMDELADSAGVDPISFRLAHLEDPRAQEVVRRAAERFGWSGNRQPAPGRGQGFAFARYKNLGAYCAIAVEADLDRDSGWVTITRVTAAVDSGEAVNPDGIRNQIEGGILQSASWTLFEAVDFDTSRILSRDWSSYPILRFRSAPSIVEVAVIDRPGQPFLGTGEAAQGPTAAAIANAVSQAAGLRLRDLPLSPQRLKQAIGV